MNVTRLQSANKSKYSNGFLGYDVNVLCDNLYTF